MAETSIEWTNRTWNPIRGCSRVSSGCEKCYAEAFAARFSGPGEPYHGLAEIRRGPPKVLRRDHANGSVTLKQVEGKARARWTGEVRMVPEHLADPLKWRKPQMVFVNSMSDLFHESLTNEEIAAVFGVMAACPQHTFQVLTKRAARMRDWFAWAREDAWPNPVDHDWLASSAQGFLGNGSNGDETSQFWKLRHLLDNVRWPLPNVWLGVSVEDQKTADERIPLLLETPAAVRWVSAEPLLEAVSILRYTVGKGAADILKHSGCETVPEHLRPPPFLDWVVVGGESGNGARPFSIEWARRIVGDCQRSGVPVFVKQLGRHPMGLISAIKLTNRKGNDPAEWPEDLRVRQWPEFMGAA